MTPTAPHRLRLDGAALVANWRLLAAMSGSAACGAAVKADGYGLGAPEVVRRLAAAGARDFFVATWGEAAALESMGVAVSVLHGVRAEDMTTARASRHARPVLNTAGQIARWRDAGGGACDVMVDTGMNRLGISPDEVRGGLLDRLVIDTLMSHLACADEDSVMNDAQRAALAEIAPRVACRRVSLANSAGIALGRPFHFDLTRPGLALYGGVPRGELAAIRPVVRPEAQVLQRRLVRAGEVVGYNATWRAPVDTPVAVVNLGYADGYARSLSNIGVARIEDRVLPVIGRVSMDLIALDVTAAPAVGEGDWVAFDAALPAVAARAGRSQYELLTGLGERFDRIWTD